MNTPRPRLRYPVPAGPLMAFLGAAAVTELVLRPALEFGALLFEPAYWGWRVPAGDGHSVMVFPGLMAGDGYLIPLRDWLDRIGYKPVASGLAVNPGWSENLVESLGDQVQAEAERSGRPVTIIGHSMGGALARSIAVRRPDAVRHVIALGAPLAIDGSSPVPPSVRISSIFSRYDVIVRYPRAMANETHAQNVEVMGSHAGMAVNPEVYRALGRLLGSL